MQHKILEIPVLTKSTHKMLSVKKKHKKKPNFKNCSHYCCTASTTSRDNQSYYRPAPERERESVVAQQKWCKTSRIVVWCICACAVVAESTVMSDPAGATRLGKASIGLSVAGVVISVVVVIVVVAVYFTASASCAYYSALGTCYNHRYVAYLGRCSYGTKIGDYCYYYWGTLCPKRVWFSTRNNSTANFWPISIILCSLIIYQICNTCV